jgi:hypothetical protein
MPRWPSFAIILTLFAAFSAVAQSQDSSDPAPLATSKDSTPPAETKKPKKSLDQRKPFRRKCPCLRCRRLQDQAETGSL